MLEGIYWAIILILRLGVGLFFPFILGIRWTIWIKNAENAFRFLQTYLVKLQIITSFLFLTASPTYFSNGVYVFEIALQSLRTYWFYFLYLFLSFFIIFLYLSKYGRSKIGARLALVITGINIPLAIVGVDGILSRLHFDNSEVGIILFMFRMMLTISLLIPSGVWGIVFGDLPWTLYYTGNGFEKNVYNEETVFGRMVKRIVEDLKGLDFDPSLLESKKDE